MEDLKHEQHEPQQTTVSDSVSYQTPVVLLIQSSPV